MKLKIATVLGIIFCILVILNTVTVFYFYMQYNDNMNAITQEGSITKVRLNNLEKDTGTFRSAVDTMGSQLKSYEQNILTLENRVSSGETKAGELTSKFQTVNTAVDEWQKKYESALAQVAEIKDRTEKLLADVGELKKYGSGNVNLGKIAVQSAGEKKK